MNAFLSTCCSSVSKSLQSSLFHRRYYLGIAAAVLAKAYTVSVVWEALTLLGCRCSSALLLEVRLIRQN